MSDAGSPRYERLTVRALLLGLLMVVALNFAAPYSAFVMHSSHLATNYFPLGVAFPFFFLVAIVNVGVKLVRPSWAFKPHELAIAFIMGIVTSAIPTYGVTGYLLSIIASPFYRASPENAWAEHFHEFIPSWISPRDLEAVRWFFDGLPPGQSIPWSAWTRPLFWWVPFICVVLFVCLCLIVVQRKQWIERERLSFPLAEIPLDMVRQSDDGRFMPHFMRSWAFWLGFGIALFMVCWNIMTYFYPLFPALDLYFGWFNLGRGFPWLRMRAYLPMMAIAFMLQLDVSFSVWFFVLLGNIQIGISNRLGYTFGAEDVYNASPGYMAWQGFGAFIVMVLYGLWMARRHLADVLGKALGTRPHVDDSNEILSYRTAVFGGLAALVYIVGWLHCSGMSFPVIGLFLFAVTVLYIGLSRIVVEGGLVFLRGPIIPQSFTTYTIGSARISPQTLTALGFSYAWFCDIIATFMPNGANAVKVGHSLRIGRRAMFWAIALALFVGFGISLWYTLYLGYQTGAYNFGEWVFGRGCDVPFDNIVSKMSNPLTTDWRRMSFLGIGAAVMSVLTFMRYRFLWWPLHPFGFPLAAVGQVVWSCFSVFAGWLAKFIVMRIGGLSLYQRVKPFFMGIIFGYFTGSAISFFVDFFWFPGEGHSLYL